MGTVLKGYVERRTVEIRNPGPMEVSFRVDLSVLQDTGRQCWRHFCGLERDVSDRFQTD